MKPAKILITGANGQIGEVLTRHLQSQFGQSNVIPTDIRDIKRFTNYQHLDVLDRQSIDHCVRTHGVTRIYHLAAVLSAKGESKPMQTWDINMGGLLNVLECARDNEIEQVFFPSSIAAFGKDSPKTMTPQQTILEPNTVYGISKVAGELWAGYYHSKFNVDVRCVRLPGVISHETMPSGGTTDYAVEIFHAAIQNKKYHSFLSETTRLPMIYMPDVIKAMDQLTSAPGEDLTVRMGYNITSMSFTPGELYNEIRKHIPSFEIDYVPDFRETIARSWTESLDDSQARSDWGWSPDFDIERMVVDMLHHLKS